MDHNRIDDRSPLAKSDGVEPWIYFLAAAMFLFVFAIGMLLTHWSAFFSA